jgi:hypothetical protein
MNQQPFASLVELQRAHDDLSQSQAASGRATPDPTKVAEFIHRAVATGAVLDGREERSVAQSLTNFWANRLKSNARAAPTAAGMRSVDSGLEALRRSSSVQAAAPTETRPFPVTTDSTTATEAAATRQADYKPIEDTLLAEYDANTLGESAAAADRVIESLTGEDADLARRLILRLMRLRPEGTEFDAIPTSRAAMQAFGDSAAVDRIIERLAATGVVRLTPGENPAADRVALRSVDLRGVWPRLNEWMDARVAFRNLASSPPREGGIGRLQDSVMSWLTKQLASVSRFFVRLRRRVVPAPMTEVSERDLDDAESYHDRNARESEYLRQLRDRRRRINEANRALVWLATILFAVAVVGWWLARSQAKLATTNAEKAQAQTTLAEDRLKLSSLRQVCRAWAEVINARSAEQLQIAKFRWESLTGQGIVKGSLAGGIDLEQLGIFADAAYQQQNALPGKPSANPTEAYHLQLMAKIRNVRNELLARDTVLPSLEKAREVAFETVKFCIKNTNELLVDKKRPYADAAPFIREFWNQYWGDMILVEGGEVANAMVNYGNVVNAVRDFAVISVEAKTETELAKAPSPSTPPTGKASDAKGSPPTARPKSGKDAAPPAHPPTKDRPPAPSPKPVPPPAPPSREEIALLDRLKSLPLDQAERMIRSMRERKIPEDLLSELRSAHQRLEGALKNEGGMKLREALKH